MYTGTIPASDPNDLSLQELIRLVDEMGRNHASPDLVTLERGNRIPVSEFDFAYVRVHNAYEKKMGRR